MYHTYNAVYNIYFCCSYQNNGFTDGRQKVLELLY